MTSEYLNRPRIVCTMTTIPSRLHGLERTMKQITSKLKYWDAFYLNVPYTSSKGHPYVIPPNFLSCLSDHVKSKIILNRCEDYGPITKVLPTFMKESDPGTIIISFDDDVRLKKDVTEILLEQHRIYPNSCIGFSGWCVGRFPFKYQSAIGNEFPVEVDFLQGVHCMTYVRGLVDPNELMKFKPYIFKQDDFRLNGYLASKNVPRISIPYSPKHYLYNEYDLSRTEQISGSMDFFFLNAKLMYQFEKEGLFGKNHIKLWLNSIMGLVLLTIGLVLIFHEINRRLNGKDLIVFITFCVTFTVVMGLAISSNMLVEFGNA